MFAGLQAKLIAGALIVILLLGLAYGLIRYGESMGIAKGHAEQLELDNKTIQQDREHYATLMTAQEQQITALSNLLQQNALQQQQLVATLRDLQSQREIARTNVEHLPDAALDADIKQKLAIRPTNDTTPGFYPTELRLIDTTITDYPLQKRTNENLTSQVGTLTQRVDILDKQIDALNIQKAASVDFVNRLYGAYTSAYNAAQASRKRPLILKVLTFGLLKDRKLQLPDPISLKP